MRADRQEAASYDCIVIGAGMSGLTFAALMAQSGKRVLVVEQHYLPGGLFTSFKRGPFLFNVALEWTTDCGEGEPFHQLLAELGLAQEFPFRRLELFKSVVSPELPGPVPLYCCGEKLRQSLVAAFPHQATGIDRFLADCQVVQGDPARARELLWSAGLKSVEQMLARYFDDPLLIHLLYSVLGYPGARGVLLMYLVAALCQGQLYLPEHHDHRRLALLLHRKVGSWGGEVRYRTAVSRILVSGGAVRGVRLESGEELSAPLVVAGVDAEELYRRLLGGEYVDSSRATELLGREPGLSTFSVFLGLDRPLSVAGAEDYAWTVLSDTASWQADATDLAHAPLRVEFQSALHPQLAPGKSTLCVWAAAPVSAFDYWGQGRDCERDELDAGRYEEAKNQATEIVLGRLERVIPGLRSRIELIETATPFTYKHYTRNRAGSVSGFSLATLHYLKATGSDTPVAGLHHVGHWIVQSGVNSVMYSAAALYRSLFPR